MSKLLASLFLVTATAIAAVFVAPVTIAQTQPASSPAHTGPLFQSSAQCMTCHNGLTTGRRRGCVVRDDVAGVDDGACRTRPLLAGRRPSRSHGPPARRRRRSKTNAPAATCRWRTWRPSVVAGSSPSSPTFHRRVRPPPSIPLPSRVSPVRCVTRLRATDSAQRPASPAASSSRPLRRRKAVRCSGPTRWSLARGRSCNRPRACSPPRPRISSGPRSVPRATRSTPTR